MRTVIALSAAAICIFCTGIKPANGTSDPPVSTPEGQIKIPSIYESAPGAEFAVKQSDQSVGVLASTNYSVNRGFTFVHDMEQYGVSDKWVASPATWAGDCEDYALTKRDILIARGYPADALEVAHVIVLTGQGVMAHAVLVAPTINSKGERVDIVLDNRYDELMTRAALEALNYVWVEPSVNLTGKLKEVVKTE